MKTKRQWHLRVNNKTTSKYRKSISQIVLSLSKIFNHFESYLDSHFRPFSGAKSRYGVSSFSFILIVILIVIFTCFDRDFEFQFCPDWAQISFILTMKNIANRRFGIVNFGPNCVYEFWGTWLGKPARDWV